MYYEKNTNERVIKILTQPEFGRFLGFDYVKLWVGNSKQAASFYTSRLGFSPFAYSGLETGSREWTTTVVRNGKVMIAFSTPLNTNNEFKDHIDKHGDGVREIAFTVEDATKVYSTAVSRGAKPVQEPIRLEDKNGWVIISSVLSYGDTVHTFVQRDQFSGVFLPNYQALEKEDPINEIAGKLNYGFIDHIVGNHAVGGMETSVEWYEKMLSFHRFWSIDDSVIHTEYR